MKRGEGSERILSGIESILLDMGGTLELHRRWYDDALPALNRLSGSHRLIIAANQGASARPFLERGVGRGILSAMYLSEEVGLLKPDPEFFKLIILNEGLEPASTLMVGDDLENDIAPAQALGMRTVWIKRGPGLEFARRLGLEEQIQPDHVVTTLEALR